MQRPVAGAFGQVRSRSREGASSGRTISSPTGVRATSPTGARSASTWPMSTAMACRSCCAATRIGCWDPVSRCGATPARRRNRGSCWTARCHGAGTTWRSGFASWTTPRSAGACARAGTAITVCTTSGRWAPIRGSRGASRTPGGCSARAARSSTSAWSRAIRSTRAAMGRSTSCAATWPATSPWCATSARAMRRRSRSPSGSPTPAACRCGSIARGLMGDHNSEGLCGQLKPLVCD